jgi:S-adenosylmethionine/arginine decarboxylase-like enzyme
MEKIERINCIIASLHECQVDLYKLKENTLETILRDVAKAINAEIARTISHSYEGCGITSCAIIKNPNGYKASHVVISTYPESNYASITIESCITSDLYKGLFVVYERLKPRKIKGFYVNFWLSPETLPSYEMFELGE